MAIATTVLVIIFLCMRWAKLCSSLNETSFFYPNFETNLTTDVSIDIQFYGAASVRQTAPAAVDLINQTNPVDQNIAGVMLSRIPLNVWENKNGCTEKNATFTGTVCVPGTAASFIITFQMRLESLTTDFYAGKGMLFFLLDNTSNPLGAAGSHFGVFPAGGDDSDSNIWGVEFDTHLDADVYDIDDNHVGIDNNNAVSETVRSMQDLDFDLNGGPVTVWIEYNFLTTTLEVRLSASLDRPAAAFLHVNGIDMRNVLGQNMYPGFSAVGNDQTHQIFLWSIESSVSAKRAYSNTPPPAKPTPPPSPTALTALSHLDFKAFVKASGLTLSIAGLALVAVVFLALRLTKCGQRVLLKMYAKVEKYKCCSALCGLGVCVMFCTIPRDPTASNLGKPIKTNSPRSPKNPRSPRKRNQGKQTPKLLPTGHLQTLTVIMSSPYTPKIPRSPRKGKNPRKGKKEKKQPDPRKGKKEKKQPV